PNIFTRFYRVDSSRTKATGGTGLGLAIARDIIDMHHASIEVTSELGSGTTFTITFPLLSEDDSADISPEE
ncbi:MAG: ATP-binding protein, partial [Negativicoccus succinicivorans]|nr:ATP-binding protein [Negativicoccus succinicivorans]